MPKTQLRQRTSARISPKRILGLLVALLAAFLLLTSVVGLGQKYFGIRRHIRDLKNEQANLSAKEKALSAKNAYISTPEGQEEELRTRYNLVKPGEGMIVITTPDEPVVVNTAPKGNVVSRLWDSILHGLGIRKDQ